MISSVSQSSSYYDVSPFLQKKSETDDIQVQQKVAELQGIDTKVRAHEMAHQATGGGFAGSPSYTTEKGPDGKDYVVAGEVPIKIEKGKTPDETISNMTQIKAAALAPADPSPQDLKVAQTADMIAGEAQKELNDENSPNQSQNNNDEQQHQSIDIYA